LDFVKWLVAKGVNLNDVDDDAYSPLHNAATSGNKELVEWLLTQGFDVDMRNQCDCNFTPLHEAAKSGHVEIVECLLSHDADVNAKMSDGGTALHAAAEQRGSKEVAECLINHGIDVNAENIFGETALQSTEYHNQEVRDLKDSANNHSNLEVTPGIHWIFMQSLKHKGLEAFKNNCGKWKYDATDNDDLTQAERLIPYVVEGKLPVVKITNIGNVFSGDRLIVVYCFSEEAKPAESGELLNQMFDGQFYWGSDWFSPPSK